MILLLFACAIEEGPDPAYRPPASFQTRAVAEMASQVPSELDPFLGGVQQRALAGQLTLAALESIEADVLAISEEGVTDEEREGLLRRWQVEPTPFRREYRREWRDTRSLHIELHRQIGFTNGCQDPTVERCSLVHADGRRYTVWTRARTWSGTTETTWSDRSWGAYCEEPSVTGTSIRYEYYPNAGTPDPGLPERWEPDGTWVVGEQRYRPQRAMGLFSTCAWFP